MEHEKTRLRSTRPQPTSHRYGRKNMYIAKDNQDIFAAAEAYALSEGLSLSSLIAEALDKYLNTNRSNSLEIIAIMKLTLNAIAHGNPTQDQAVRLAQDALLILKETETPAS